MKKYRIPLSSVVISLIAMLAILRFVGAIRPIEDALRWAIVPLARVFSFTGFEIANRTAPLLDAETLDARVRDLEARLSAIHVDYIQLKALEEENISLKAVSGFLNSSGYDHVGARIIARSTDPQVSSVLIDRGARDGLEIGMAVISGDGVFLGKISSLQQTVATVLLIADRRSRVAAARSGGKKLFGIVEGQGNGVGRLTLVPQAESLQRNDSIVTAGTEDKVPGNLAIGLVNDVQGQPTDPFKTATIEPFIRPETISLVVVLRPGALRPETAR